MKRDTFAHLIQEGRDSRLDNGLTHRSLTLDTKCVTNSAGRHSVARVTYSWRYHLARPGRNDLLLEQLPASNFLTQKCRAKIRLLERVKP